MMRVGRVELRQFSSITETQKFWSVDIKFHIAQLDIQVKSNQSTHSMGLLESSIFESLSLKD